jgi:redox-sensitive bicupin YhaK (pirin superfamily)
MIIIRRGSDRGRFNHGWLDTSHTFSFGGYQDPEQMGFRALRVINEDRVQPGKGFGTHPHRDMEIITYVLDGALEHKDSMGTGSVIRPGDVQRMSAGTGVTHSEFNHSQDDIVHFVQIWILPRTHGIEPGYEQKTFEREEKLNRLCLIASGDGADGSITVHQDLRLHAALIEPGQRLDHRLTSSRHAWVQVLRGTVQLEGDELRAGDGAALSDVSELAISTPANGGAEGSTGVSGTGEAEVLVFELP